MRRSFTMLEMIFVIVIIGILAGVALPKFLNISKKAHEANLISFVKTLNRTTGEDLWSKSIYEGKHGSIKHYSSILKYIDIPVELNESDINLSNCGSGRYAAVAYSDTQTSGGIYVIECKDGTPTTAPYFRLVRLDDNKTLAGRE